MKLPTLFKPEDLEEKTKALIEKPSLKKPEEAPKEIETIEDAVKYIANSEIPVYGYDQKKRIHLIEIPLKEILKQQMSLGWVNLHEDKPIRYKHFFFTRDPRPNYQEFLRFSVSIDSSKFTCNLTKEDIASVKMKVYEKQNLTWRATFCSNNFFPDIGPCIVEPVKTPEEILWVFETFKEFTPRIHGGALRDMYLGIDRTADIDVEVAFSPKDYTEKKLRKLIEKQMDSIEISQKGRTQRGGYMGNVENVVPCRYRGVKDGVVFDIFEGTFERYLSTDQVLMKKPGELIIYDITKNDLDNKQFRVINSESIKINLETENYVFKKIKKLKDLGLEFLAEDPSDLSKKIRIYDSGICFN